GFANPDRFWSAAVLCRFGSSLRRWVGMGYFVLDDLEVGGGDRIVRGIQGEGFLEGLFGFVPLLLLRVMPPEVRVRVVAVRVEREGLLEQRPGLIMPAKPMQAHALAHQWVRIVGIKTGRAPKPLDGF